MKLESRQSQYCPRVDFKCANSFCELHKSSGLNENCFSPTQTEHLRGINGSGRVTQIISPDVRLTWAGNIWASDRRIISLQLHSCSQREQHQSLSKYHDRIKSHISETSGVEVYINQLRFKSLNQSRTGAVILQRLRFTIQTTLYWTEKT